MIEEFEVFTSGKAARKEIEEASGKYLGNIDWYNAMMTLFVDVFRKNKQLEDAVFSLTCRINDLENKQ